MIPLGFIENCMKDNLLESAPLLRIAVCLMAGIVVGDSVSIPVPLFFVFAGCVVVALLLWRFACLQSVAIGVCCFVLGALLTVNQGRPTRKEYPSGEIRYEAESRLDRTRLFFLQQRSRLLSHLETQGGGDEAYAVVAAMTLGDKSALTKDLREVYSVTGASHVLALSGLHLGIIYALLSLFTVGRRWQVATQALVIVCIWAFVFLVGMTISVVRSATMLTVYSLLSLGHRDKMSLNVLAFAAIVMLMTNPLSLFDVGFLMSFAAVASILLFFPLFQGFLPQGYLLEHPLVRWGCSMVVVSLSAQVGVAPLIAYYFGRLSTFFLITNFIVIPAVTLILYGSLVVLLVPSLAYILLYSVSWLNVILGYISRLPGATIEMHPTPLQTVMVYVIIVACYLLIGRIVPKVGWSPSRKGL